MVRCMYPVEDGAKNYSINFDGNKRKIYVSWLYELIEGEIQIIGEKCNVVHKK
jgi:L-rhamnose mutarotase